MPNKPETQQKEEYKETELGLLPKSWGVVKLKNLNKEKKKSLTPANFPDETFEYYSIPAYQENKNPIPEKGKKILSQKLLLKKGTILFGKLNPRVEKVWLVESNTENRIIGSTEWMPIVPDNHVIDSKYMYYLQWSEYVMPLAKSFVSGSTPSRQRVDPKAYYDIKIPLPPLSEQQKITFVLSTIQTAKEKTEQVINATKELKKSMMKHLFTYGPVGLEDAENVKLKKTEIGMVPEDWDIDSLGNIVIEDKGLQRGPWGGSIKKEIFVPEGYRVYEQGNVIMNNFDVGNYYIDENKFEELKSFEVKEGDILISAAGTLGKVAIIPQGAKPGIINQALLRVRLNHNVINQSYFIYLFRNMVEHNLMEQYSHGATLKNLSSLKVLRSIKIPLPPIAEQQQISSILSTIDTKLQSEESKNNALEELFKSMLHNLMTAKIRVNDMVIGNE